MYAQLWRIWKPRRIVVLVALSPLAVYVLFLLFCATHTAHTHTHTLTLHSILPVHPSLSIILPSMELPEKWLSFKWPTQHGKITRLSSRSALCVDIALAHEPTNTQPRICARLCICIPHTHTHSHTTDPAYMFSCVRTDVCTHTPHAHTPTHTHTHTHTFLLWSCFLILISSFFYHQCTLPYSPTLPVIPCLPHRGDFTQSEIQRCQHMSRAINLCHRAISLGSLCLIHYHRGLHAGRLGSVLIIFTGRISPKKEAFASHCVT